MASWHPHNEAWDGVERRQESALGLCSCGRQYPDALSSALQVCPVCDLEQELQAVGDEDGHSCTYCQAPTRTNFRGYWLCASCIANGVGDSKTICP